MAGQSDKHWGHGPQNMGFAEQAIWSEWTTLVYCINYSMGSSCSVLETRATQGDNTRTVSKSLSNILVSLQKSWNLVPSTEPLDIPWQREHSSTLRTVDLIESLVPEKEERTLFSYSPTVCLQSWTTQSHSNS